jgi:hypothetical protein
MRRDTTTYCVFLLQASGEAISVKESKNFEECKAVFDAVEAEWEKSRKTKGAVFKMRDPFVFSCDPSFILRVSLVPKVTPKLASSQNPYQKRMEEVGFGAMQRVAPTVHGELTDEGYTSDEK